MPFFLSHFKKSTIELEKVYKTTIKMIKELEKVLNKKRLRSCELLRFEKKLIHNKYDGDLCIKSCIIE